MPDDGAFDFDMAEIANAIVSTAETVLIRPIEALPRIDAFHGCRAPEDGCILGVEFPWAAPGVCIVDYYRSPAGWLVFLETGANSLTIRLRHEDTGIEPTHSKLGITRTWRAGRRGPFDYLRRIIFSAVNEDRSPLYDLMLARALPDLFAAPLRQRLPTPLDLSLTVMGDTAYPARDEILSTLLRPVVERHPSN
ncbi:MULTISPECIES: hypothetical protein [Candidatus Accumulibacter]|uniref:Uncharacterized protein n=2 Tax=Candidatus Accumulibacter TaxID=327159 RepID=A0A080M7B3_9PROT|nr:MULTISPECIES: hypothetical protein [Candidatus Accumulibacter]KFB76380.1 MAG: hypothetical protein AW06_002523 [Candidatus Accumulibacter cognatus]TMQ78662.1 hypothetical protein ACCUM_0959 [Candidatus Accumulibacter phosphatis]